jgi:hypothetical protein
MDLYPDFKEFLQFLNEEKVEFLVGGGYALTFHGIPRDAAKSFPSHFHFLNLRTFA